MTLVSTTRALVGALLLTGAMALGGCAPGGDADASPSPAVTEQPDAASPTETESSDPESSTVEVTCQNTVTAEALAAFTGDGWTGEPSQEPWLIAGVPVEGGVQCRWMEDHTVATDNYLATAWGPLSTEETDAAVAGLLAEGGWIREDGEAGIYLTVEGAEMMPVVDMEGYASTHLFTGDQVRYANTKADLALIVAPADFAP